MMASSRFDVLRRCSRASRVLPARRSRSIALIRNLSSSCVRPHFLVHSRTTRYSVFKDRTKPCGVCLELVGRSPLSASRESVPVDVEGRARPIPAFARLACVWRMLLRCALNPIRTDQGLVSSGRRNLRDPDGPVKPSEDLKDRPDLTRPSPPMGRSYPRVTRAYRRLPTRSR
jgi:hypothetical protein